MEAKKILSGKGKDTKLGYEQKITLDYLRKFAVLNKSDVDNAVKELEGIGVLKEHQIVILIDLLPKTEDDVKTIFMKERTALNKEQIKSILDVLDKIRPKKKRIVSKKKTKK